MLMEDAPSTLWSLLFACTLYCAFSPSVGDGANQTVARLGRYEFITQESRTTKKTVRMLKVLSIEKAVVEHR